MKHYRHLETGNKWSVEERYKALSREAVDCGCDLETAILTDESFIEMPGEEIFYRHGDKILRVDEFFQWADETRVGEGCSLHEWLSRHSEYVECTLINGQYVPIVKRG